MPGTRKMTISTQVTAMMATKMAFVRRVSFCRKRIIGWVTTFSASSARARPPVYGLGLAEDDFPMRGDCKHYKRRDSGLQRTAHSGQRKAHGVQNQRAGNREE